MEMTRFTKPGSRRSLHWSSVGPIVCKSVKSDVGLLGAQEMASSRRGEVEREGTNRWLNWRGAMGLGWVAVNLTHSARKGRVS